MFQARLAAELFLKAAILKRAPDAQPKTHDLAGLVGQYNVLYPEPDYRLSVPFLTQVIGDSGPTAEAIIKTHDRANPMDQRFRYPVDKDFELWPGIDGCDPELFLPVITKLTKDIAKVRAMIF